MKDSFLTGNFQVANATVPLVSTELHSADFWGAVMVRWGFNRDNYRVSPGLYAVGNPDQSSDVFVTANYKLSFDTLRKSLSGINGWILVLDTNGINVWCAAGKGTFGTNELIRKIRQASLEKVIHHKRIILPQLGATGVAAHKIKEETGFNVQYGPVRASDIKKFIKNGYRADKEMRRVTFRFMDRIKLISNDLLYGKFYLLGAIAIILAISGVAKDGFAFRNLFDKGSEAIINLFFAYISGIVITPMFLPYIPGRSFAMKGFLCGSLTFIILLLSGMTGSNLFENLSWFLIITAVSSFMAMNFTGSSTFTSLSGVKKEMRFSMPVQIGFAVAGVILQVIGKIL